MRLASARSFQVRLPMLVLGLLVLGGSGCKQGEGDRCEIPSDCGSGLSCVNNAAGTGDMVCLRSGTSGPPRPDAATSAPADAAQTPATPMDAGTASDGPSGPAAPSDGPAPGADAAVPDARGTSGGTSDGASDGASGG